MHDQLSGHPATSLRLAREWAVIRCRPSFVARADSWRICTDPVASLDAVVRAVGGGGDLSDAADHRLRRLVAIARTDDLAARVVVERLTPGLLAIARRHRRRDPGAFEELLAAVWIAVRTYNPARRPATIAAALLSDAEYTSYRRPQRHRSASEIPLAHLECVADEPEIDPADELAALVELARAAGMPAADLDLIDRLVATPCTEALGAELDVTSRMIRYRREAVTAALREIALAA